MIYILTCTCGESISIQRAKLGYRTCLSCGELEASTKKQCVVPMHKSNYVYVSNIEMLQGINNKGGIVK